jgi:hypothetical protein
LAHLYPLATPGAEDQQNEALRAKHKRIKRDEMLVWVAVILALLGNVVAATALAMTIQQQRALAAKHRRARHPSSTPESGS